MRNKGDKKGNITAAFGSDLTLEGMTSVPNLMLKYYSKIGISDSEMMLLIQLMHLQTAANQSFPSLDQIAQYMVAEPAKIKADLAVLIEKGILSIDYNFCETAGDVVSCYSFEPLFEKLSEFWACEKVRAYQQMKKSLQGTKTIPAAYVGEGRKKAFSNICQTFEQEFGRLLSPLEIEQVSAWLDDFDGPSELIVEALKRAVMLGKHNFKYIDTILREWRKNNLKSAADVLAHEANFRQGQTNRPPARTKPQRTPEKKKDKFRLLYLS